MAADKRRWPEKNRKKLPLHKRADAEKQREFQRRLNERVEQEAREKEADETRLTPSIQKSRFQRHNAKLLEMDEKKKEGIQKNAEKSMVNKKIKIKEIRAQRKSHVRGKKYGLIGGTYYPERTPAHMKWCNHSASNGFYICRECHQRIFHIIDNMNETEKHYNFSYFAGEIEMDPPDYFAPGPHRVNCGYCFRHIGSMTGDKERKPPLIFEIMKSAFEPSLTVMPKHLPKSVTSNTFRVAKFTDLKNPLAEEFSRGAKNDQQYGEDDEEDSYIESEAGEGEGEGEGEEEDILEDEKASLSPYIGNPENDPQHPDHVSNLKKKKKKKRVSAMKDAEEIIKKFTERREKILSGEEFIGEPLFKEESPHDFTSFNKKVVIKKDKVKKKNKKNKYATEQYDEDERNSNKNIKQDDVADEHFFVKHDMTKYNKNHPKSATSDSNTDDDEVDQDFDIDGGDDDGEFDTEDDDDDDDYSEDDSGEDAEGDIKPNSHDHENTLSNKSLNKESTEDEQDDAEEDDEGDSQTTDN